MKENRFYEIKIRCYPTDYYVKKFHNNEKIGHIKLKESVELYNDFYWKFIEFLTGQSREDYFLRYNIFLKECVEEEVLEIFGIKIFSNSGKYSYFLIPRELEHIILWVKENINIDYKEINRKTFLNSSFFEVSNYHRECSIAFMETKTN